MVDTYIGALRLFPYNFAPRNFQYCQGQLLAIQTNTALFAILGTTYGGNGSTTFGLPDLRGRAPVSIGQSPGNSNYVLGQMTGTESETLLSTQLPAHTHVAQTKAQIGGTTQMHHTAVTGDYLSRYNTSDKAIGLAWNNPPLSQPTSLAPQTIGTTGGTQPHSNMQPYLGLAWCICTQGIFPTRS